MADLFDEFGIGSEQVDAPDLFDEFGLGESLKPVAEGITDTLWEGTKSAGRAIGATVDAYTGDNQGIVDKAAAQQAAPKDSRVEKFHQDFAQRTEALGEDPGVLDTIGEGLGAVWDNPAGAGLAIVEQLPNAVPTLAGGWAGMKGGAAAGAVAGAPFAGVGAGPGAVIGGVVGGLAGMFLGNAAIETGHKAMGMADDGEVTDEERGQAIEEGALKGAVITGVDALTLGVGGKVAGAMQRTASRAMESATRKVLVDRGIDVTDEAAVLAARSNPEIATAVRSAQESARAATDKLGRRLATGGTLLTMETVGEGVGEYLGEMAATGEGNVPDAVLESLLSLGQSGAETAWNVSRTRARPDALVQPTPTAENPNPAPVERPDPSAGPLSAAANLLPAPSIAGALPAPGQTLYGDGLGNVSPDGPGRDVDREYRPVPGREQPVRDFGPGMDQQYQQGAAPGIEGQLIRASRQQQAPAGREPQTFDAVESPRLPAPAPRIADGRQDAVIVDAAGNAVPGKLPGQQPEDYVQGGRGMDQQAPTRTFSNVLAAKNAISKSPNPAQLEVVPVGPKQFEIRSKRAVPTKGARKTVDREKDSVVQAIARLGGIKTEWRQDTTGEAKGNRIVPGVGALWTDKTGTSIDDMASLLQQNGYVPAGEMEKDGGVSWLQAAISDELSGRKTHLAPGSKRQEEETQQLIAQREADIAAQQEAAGDFDSAEVIVSDLLDDLDIMEIRAERARKFAEELDAIFEGGTNENSTSTASADNRPAEDARTENGAGGSAGAGESGPVQQPDARAESPAEVEAPSLELSSYTEQDLAAQAKLQAEAEAKNAAETKAVADKAQADRERNDFTLSGSDRPSDVAASRGQNDMFAPPTRGQVKGEWVSFPADSGTLGIPRAEMPQIKAEHRGAMVNFLNARDVAHAEETIAASELKPTQAEYSTKKVEAAKAFDGGERSILISSDGHVLDGHHQWLARREAGEDVKVIRLDAPIRQLLDTVAEFPSASVDTASAGPASTPQAARVEDAGEKLGGARKDELRSVRERLDSMDDAAIANSTLSQLWPKDEIIRIEDLFHAASYQTVREIIPAKPRVPYKVRAWVEKVKGAREILKHLAQLGADTTVAKMRAFSPGLRPIADKIELLMGIDRAQWGRIGRVSMASGRYSEGGKMVPGSWVEVEVDGRKKHFFGKNSVAEAVDDIRAVINLNSAPEARMKFAIYTDRRSGEVFIAKDGDKEQRRLKTFGKVAEARKFVADNHADLVTAWDAVKNRDNVTKADMRRDTNEDRAGRDYRNGADITPEQFIEAFGFRGVEFGNWVAQGSGGADRQGMLNQAYDAFMDLADVVGVPPKALSLEGRLGVGFGSRGRGRASAHFEPGNVVINLTKTKGAGSLAHEWFHALDNYFARQRGGEVPMERGFNAQQAYRNNNFITYRPEPLYIHKTKQSKPVSLDKLRRYHEHNPTAEYYNPENWQVDPRHPTGVRPEVERAFAELVEVLDQSPMSRRSAALDKTPDAYWSQIIERGARAFETYVIAKLADQGYRNDYLANVRSLEEFARAADRYPYLTPDEQGPVSEAFDKLFSTVQTKEGEDGQVALYSRESYRRASSGQAGVMVTKLSSDISSITRGWRNAPKIEVVQSIKDLPDAQRRVVERDGAFDTEGMLSDGTVYLVADNLRDVQHAAFVLQHEVLGHAGLQGAYGQRLTPLLMSLYNDNPALKLQADELVRRFGYKPAVAMEEVLADMAAAGSLQQQGFWPRLLAAMRAALRSIGLNMKWSEGDIQALLASARRYVQRGRRPGPGRTVFSRNGSSGRLVEMLDDQGRLLAPDGKPSKLNKKQWHQVRSDNFKRWFGDWQSLSAQERLDAIQPLKLRMPEAWRGLSERERLKRIEESLKAMARASEALPHDELGQVVMAMSGAKKAASSAADPAKQAVLSRLQQSFERSVYASAKLSTQDGQTAAYHKLLAPIDVDGLQLVAIFTVREDANGRMFYNTVAVDRKEKALAVSPGDVSNAQGSLPANAKALDTFVRRPLARVNPQDVSAVTGGNGEPLVLYHGTGEQFFVFDQSRAGRSTGHTSAPLGIFLTTDKETAKAYAEKATDGMPGLANVMPLFASIKQPYRMSLAESQTLDTPEAAIALRQKLEREGHDGIRLGDTGVWIAFYNAQVKSATNNTGAFDEIDPDIRYSRASQRDTEALRKLGLAGSEAQNLLDQVGNLTLGGLQQKLKDWAVRSEEGIFDGLAGIKRAEESVGVTDPNQQGYVSARMASGIADVMHGVLHYAAPEWRDGVVSGKAGTRGVLEILGDLGQDNLTAWLGWLGGKRAQLLKAQGRENNLTDADIAELVAMGKGKEALFEKVYREYAQVNEAVLDLAQEAGLIDQDARAKWLTDYYVPFYRQDEAEGIFTAPRSKRGLSHQTAAIKALKGGTLPTNDLLANMLAGWTKRIDASMKNKALLEVVANLKGSDFLADESPRWQQVLISRDQIAQQIRKDRKALALAAEMLDLPAGANVLQVVNKLMKPESEGFEQMWTRVAPTDPDIIRVQRDGKSEYYRVTDESLLRGLKFIEGSVFNDPITKIGRAFKRLLTTGVTASPDFILRNFIRDAAHAWMINKDGFTLGKDSIKGMRDALREDQDYRDLMFAGGSFQGGYVHGADPEASAQIIRRALEKKGFTSRQQDAYIGSLVNTPAKAAAMLGKGWQKYRELGDKVENANRLSTYKAARDAGKSRRQASFEAKDLMDYSLRGNFAAAQWFTDVVPFLNARLQGLYKLGRAVKGDKTLLAKEVAMKGGYIALFSLLLAGINDDDERYQALQDWDKDMHWHIFLGDEHFRIPKPFELGLLFGTVPERLLHTLTGSQDGGDLAKAVAQGVFQTLAFNPVPQFYQPIRELQANRNFFRDAPIEDMSDEGKLPEARYDERTSAIGRVLGQITGPTIGLSPKQIDHLVQGYTGTIGGYVLGMSSLVAAGFTEGKGPAWRASDLPVAKVLYQGDAPRSSKYQAEFYDMLTEADQLHRTLKSYREEGRLEAAADLLESSQEKLRHRPALGMTRRQLGQIRNQMDAIYRSTTMDGEQKRQQLDALQRRANEVAERVVRAAGGDF